VAYWVESQSLVICWVVEVEVEVCWAVCLEVVVVVAVVVTTMLLLLLHHLLLPLTTPPCTYWVEGYCWFSFSSDLFIHIIFATWCASKVLSS
jgi:hypothetical protein